MCFSDAFALPLVPVSFWPRAEPNELMIVSLIFTLSIRKNCFCIEDFVKNWELGEFSQSVLFIQLPQQPSGNTAVPEGFQSVKLAVS